MTDNTTPAGWYPDGGGALRWWDGTQWTEHRQPEPPPSESAPTLSASTPTTSPRTGNPWYRRRWVVGVVALLVGIGIGSSGASGSSDPKKSDQYKTLSASYSSARGDASTLRSSLADARAKEETLKSELAKAKDAEAAAKKKAKSAQALLAASVTPKKPKPKPATLVAPTTHACTKTSSGSCIQGGEFCRQALYGQPGWNASGTRYTCTGNHTHPHWE